MAEKLEKITVLEGYYATGDHECFVFDKHAGPCSHYEDVYGDYDARRAKLMENAPMDDMEALQKYRDEVDEKLGPYPDDTCRVYPNELLPDDPEIRTRKGRWVIKVEFFPDDG
jgi:hypothetical protein